MKNLIPIYKPFLPQKSLKYAQKALEDGRLSSNYNNIIMEDFFKEYLGVKRVLLTNNGTTATHLVAKGLKYKYPNIKNIIVPNIVYVAAWNSFLFDKEYNLFSGKTDDNTWNLDLENANQIYDNLENSAILSIPNIGNPLNTDKFENRVFVQDACESFFAKNKKEHTCTKGLLSSLSFFGNKNITSGEGGAVVTNDSDVYEYLKSLRGQGQSQNKKYIHDVLGYNYRMTNIQAAILRGQFDYFNEIIERKEYIWNKYTRAFKDNENIRLQKTEKDCEHSKWMFGIRFVNLSCDYNFEKIEKFFNDRNVDIRPMFYPIHYHKYLRDINNNGVLSIQSDEIGDEISRTTIMIPSYPDLTDEELDIVIKAVNEFVK